MNVKSVDRLRAKVIEFEQNRNKKIEGLRMKVSECESTMKKASDQMQAAVYSADEEKYAEAKARKDKASSEAETLKQMIASMEKVCLFKSEEISRYFSEIAEEFKECERKQAEENNRLTDQIGKGTKELEQIRSEANDVLKDAFNYCDDSNKGICPVIASSIVVQWGQKVLNNQAAFKISYGAIKSIKQ